MSTPQTGPGGIDVKLDEQGRIVVTSPQLAKFVSTGGEVPIDPGFTNNNCQVNLVAGCGTPQ